jgi:uncharacterized membrane protein YebE (DUF533 family)
MLGGGKSKPSQPPRSESRREFDDDVQIRGPRDIDRAARELEDLLNVANKRQTGSARGSGASRAQPTQPSRETQIPSDKSGQSNSPAGSHRWPRVNVPEPRIQPESQNEQALVLTRAMINAAKADGQITQDEQQAILKQIGNTNRDTVEFLRREFNAPVNVREFVWTVPLGMEEQVYMMSLIGMELDTQNEANYLAELAFGLRIPPETCNQIHERMGAPQIFNTAGR